jgi:hypothetical protein
MLVVRLLAAVAAIAEENLNRSRGAAGDYGLSTIVDTIVVSVGGPCW